MRFLALGRSKGDGDFGTLWAESDQSTRDRRATYL